jgi:hypothetical protein
MSHKGGECLQIFSTPPRARKKWPYKGSSCSTILQLNGHHAHISVEAPARPALEEKGIYFSIGRSLFSRELVKEGQYTHC